MTDATTERTQAVAITEVRYAIHFATRNEALWRHVDTGINVINAFAGSAAFASLLGASGTLANFACGAVAVFSGIALVTRPGVRAVEFRDFKLRFAALDAVADGMSRREIDGRLKVLRQEAPMGFKSLSTTAWNDAMLADGHNDRVRPYTRFERLMQIMA